MKTALTQTTAPMHVVVLATGTMEDLRMTLDSMPGKAGYPYCVTVVELTGDAVARNYLNTMQEWLTLQNLVMPPMAAAPTYAISHALQKVDAPYVLLIPAGKCFSEAGWLRQTLGTMLQKGATALASNGSKGPVDIMEPVHNPNILSGYLCDNSHTILATRGTLERLGMFTDRCDVTKVAEPSRPHSAELAAQTARRHAYEMMQ